MTNNTGEMDIRVQRKFDAIDSRFTRIEKQIIGTEEQFTGMEQKVDNMADTVTEILVSLAEIRARLDDLITIKHKKKLQRESDSVVWRKVVRVEEIDGGNEDEVHMGQSTIYAPRKHLEIVDDLGSDSIDEKVAQEDFAIVQEQTTTEDEKEDLQSIVLLGPLKPDLIHAKPVAKWQKTEVSSLEKLQDSNPGLSVHFFYTDSKSEGIPITCGGGSEGRLTSSPRLRRSVVAIEGTTSHERLEREADLAAIPPPKNSLQIKEKLLSSQNKGNGGLWYEWVTTKIVFLDYNDTLGPLFRDTGQAIWPIWKISNSLFKPNNPILSTAQVYPTSTRGIKFFIDLVIFHHLRKRLENYTCWDGSNAKGRVAVFGTCGFLIEGQKQGNPQHSRETKAWVISLTNELQGTNALPWSSISSITFSRVIDLEETRCMGNFFDEGVPVRGMMYYRRALKLQAFLDMANEDEILKGYKEMCIPSEEDKKSQRSTYAKLDAMADLKFTYVATCQNYGNQKRSGDRHATDILNLMVNNPSLRVAYIDEMEEGETGKVQKVYYSVLVKALDNLDQEIYRIKLPGSAKLGEGKPENQNHAVIFTRGEALQAIDMNQDNYLEEAFKMRNLLQEFHEDHGVRPPTILGVREHIFTGSVSSLAWFMSNQETSFVTIGQRVLARPLKIRFHYGHPDVFDRIFHITRGGMSKASRGINLSEDIFAGFNSTLRRGNVTHHEYIQVGKGRDVGLNQISLFEAKVACGNGEQTLSRDIYRLGHRFDFFRMLSCYFTTIGFYVSAMLVVLTVYVYLYGKLYLSLSGLESSIMKVARRKGNDPLKAAMASQSVVQLGLLMALPMVMEIGLERGFRTALGDIIIMQLQLCAVFFTFSLGTKAHYYGRTILHGGAKYRATGRGFVVRHEKFAENYRMYSRSHFTKGLELMILLICYQIYGSTNMDEMAFLFLTASMWFLVVSWLFAPFLFNPSGFEWQKIVDDWEDWTKWISNQGGIGVPANKSWESWWDEEQEHLEYTGFIGRVCEIILAFRFFLFQYGIVYQLHVTRESPSGRSRSIAVYGLSWLVIVALMLILKIVSKGRKKFSADFQLMFRLLKLFLFIGFVATLVILFTTLHLTVGDIFQSLLAFLPTGWAILQVAQASRPLIKAIKMWGSVKALARGYEYMMGIAIFTPVAVLAWFPFVSEFQTRLLFNQAFSRGLQIQRILAGGKKNK